MNKKRLHEIIKKSVTVNGIPIGELLPESKEEEDSDKELKLSFNINVTVRDKK